MTHKKFVTLALSLIFGWLLGGGIKTDIKLKDIGKQLTRIEAHQTEIIDNQIQIIENQSVIDQDSFHSNE